MWLILAVLTVVILIIIIALSSEKFSDILQALTLHGKVSKVILFSSKTCHVCQELLTNTWPQLQQSLQDITFEKIDCVDDPIACSRYGIYAVPTVVIIKNEVPIVYRGAWRYADIYSYLKSL